jgi:hypothetical protein
VKDLNRFSSPFLRVVFEGPDLSEEALYDLLRVRFPTHAHAHALTRILAVRPD